MRPGFDEIIYRFNPEAKILIMIREPIARALSLCAHACRNQGRVFDPGRMIDEGHDAARIRYAEMIAKYHARFGRERVKVLVHEEFVRDQRTVVAEICAFAGIARMEPAGEAFENPGGDTDRKIDVGNLPRRGILRRRRPDPKSDQKGYPAVLV